MPKKKSERKSKVSDKKQSKPLPEKKFIRKIRDAIRSYYLSGTRIVEQAIIIGMLMIELREELGAKRFHKNVDRKFPGLQKRTRQRFILLAKQINLKKYPVLSTLLFSQLYNLCSLAGKDKSVGKYLIKGKPDIDTDFDTTNTIKIREFRDKVDKFISNHPKKAGKNKKDDDASEPQVFQEWLKKHESKDAKVDQNTLKGLKKIKKMITRIINRHDT